uniref:RNA helicase n=1 Tax=Cyprinodon variegatus TaxID=28743 RepID=A0A3Q2EH85_CYPVA
MFRAVAVTFQRIFEFIYIYFFSFLEYAIFTQIQQHSKETQLEKDKQIKKYEKQSISYLEVILLAHVQEESCFRYGSEQLEFPSSFSSTERAFVHRLAQSLGYSSRSKGKGSSRFLTVRKKETSAKLQPSICLDLSSSSAYFIRSLLQRFPPSKKERADLHPNAKSGNPLVTESTSGRLNNGIPMVPKKRTPSVLDAFRRSLPVTEHQDEIVQLIRDHRVVLVLGETGSGKTTQIPQFLLDDCSRYGKPCRIFCTQPRRLATIAVAERVAAERGESVGQTVGYHIRLESRVSPKTLLTFCTSGVLLRTLMAGDGSLTTVTHVIVDEVHERDGLTDFLLTKLRDVLQKVPTLKLILSSAALDIDLFLQYFGSCPVIRRKLRPHCVSMKLLKETQQKRLNEWFEAAGSGAVGATLTHMFPPGLLDAGGCGDREKESIQQSEKDPEQLKPWLLKEMDSCISSIFLHEDQDAFSQLFNLILHERVSVDYTHSETGSTPLMASAARGFLPEMQQLLSMGADINMRACNGWTALDFAEHFQQTDAVDLRESRTLEIELTDSESTLIHCSPTELNSEAQELLRQYHHSFDDQQVDLDLIMTLLLNICTNTNEGAVLIFLPGYDEIVTLRDRIFSDDRMSTHYQVFTLHSDMQTLDQKRAMKPTPSGVRKIILSTNIAETSITIDDVVFVIDSGKVKEKSFDTLSRVSMLKSVWICKASVLQRKGR